MTDFFICRRRGCIEPKATKHYCRSHSDEINKKAKERRDRRFKSGKCAKCNNPHLEHSKLCLFHYIKRVAKNTAKDEGLTGDIYQKYLDQGKRCYYTGVELILGHNASLDHVYPQSKYQEHVSNINNLVWVVKDINILKLNMELDKFLKLCENVAQNAERIRKDYNVS